MPRELRRARFAATVASFALIGAAPAAAAVAQTPSITGNGWVALGILVAVVGAIWLMISGALHLERRDAWLGRSDHNHGWFGFHDDDEDGPNTGNGSN
jgi:hypothetical protein